MEKLSHSDVFKAIAVAGGAHLACCVVDILYDSACLHEPIDIEDIFQYAMQGDVPLFKSREDFDKLTALLAADDRGYDPLISKSDQNGKYYSVIDKELFILLENKSEPYMVYADFPQKTIDMLKLYVQVSETTNIQLIRSLFKIMTHYSKETPEDDETSKFYLDNHLSALIIGYMYSNNKSSNLGNIYDMITNTYIDNNHKPNHFSISSIDKIKNYYNVEKISCSGYIKANPSKAYLILSLKDYGPLPIYDFQSHNIKLLAEAVYVLISLGIAKIDENSQYTIELLERYINGDDKDIKEYHIRNIKISMNYDTNYEVLSNFVSYFNYHKTEYDNLIIFGFINMINNNLLFKLIEIDLNYINLYNSLKLVDPEYTTDDVSFDNELRIDIINTLNGNNDMQPGNIIPNASTLMHSLLNQIMYKVSIINRNNQIKDIFMNIFITIIGLIIPNDRIITNGSSIEISENHIIYKNYINKLLSFINSIYQYISMTTDDNEVLTYLQAFNETIKDISKCYDINEYLNNIINIFYDILGYRSIPNTNTVPKLPMTDQTNAINSLFK